MYQEWGLGQGRAVSQEEVGQGWGRGSGMGQRHLFHTQFKLEESLIVGIKPFVMFCCCQKGLILS